MLVSALCVSQSSEYRSLDMVDVYDIKRDARTFNGSNPIVAHPPCRAWSACLSHQAKPLPGEMDLAHFCIDKLKSNGGVLEHPANSRLFTKGFLPLPGQRSGDLKTIEISQYWFGYPLRKLTWLCFSGVDLALLKLPFKLFPQSGPGVSPLINKLSKKQRSHTNLHFANFLVDSARLSQC